MGCSRGCALRRRLAGPPLQLELWDIVTPEALPICPTCTERHHPPAHRCPTCGEPIGPFRTWVYPDVIWIWGRGLWRLMERESVSRLVWAGMVVLGLGWMGEAVTSPAWFYDRGLGWLARPMASVWLASTLVSLVAGVRMLGKAWRLRGTWRRRG